MLTISSWLPRWCPRYVLLPPPPFRVNVSTFRPLSAATTGTPGPPPPGLAPPPPSWRPSPPTSGRSTCCPWLGWPWLGRSTCTSPGTTRSSAVRREPVGSMWWRQSRPTSSLSITTRLWPLRFVRGNFQHISKTNSQPVSVRSSYRETGRVSHQRRILRTGSQANTLAFIIRMIGYFNFNLLSWYLYFSTKFLQY